MLRGQALRAIKQLKLYRDRFDNFVIIYFQFCLDDHFNFLLFKKLEITDKKRETRYIREIISGKRRKIQYWEITRDNKNITEANSWFVMTKITELSYREVGEIYGVRTWVE